jgi:1-pyrroline-5-carboxylate dehydrogenase
MSGSDSKAGGPDYLLLFLQAKTVADKLNPAR